MAPSIWKSFSQRRQSGSAMVEFSLLMIVFVPCLLYGFFLSDGAYHQLEVQETVVSAMWDFSTRNSQGEDINATDIVLAVQNGNRAEYADHTSSYDDLGDLTGSADQNKAANQFAVQTDWVGTSEAAYGAYGAGSSPQATAITCKPVSGLDTSWLNFGLSSSSPVGKVVGALNPLTDFANDQGFNTGGEAHCWARAVAYNYLIPQQFLQDFSKVNLTNETDHSGTSVSGVSGGGTNLFLQDQAQVAFGTWALDTGELKMGDNTNDIQYGKDKANPFQARVAKIYAGYPAPKISFLLVQGKALFSFASDADSNGIMQPAEFMAVSANIPGATGDSIGSSLPGGLGKLGGIDPGFDPLMTFLVSRYDASDNNHGHHPTNHCAWPKSDLLYDADVFTCLFAGDNEYESTPTSTAFQSSNSPELQAFQQRGFNYMGTTGDKGWAP